MMKIWNSFQENNYYKMAKDDFEDITTYEKRYCKKCGGIQQHRIVSRWGVKPSKGRKQKIDPSAWEFEREIAAYCGLCFTSALPKEM
jgi:hypothetical protein